MPSDTQYGNKYKYILAGIDAASRYKIARLLRKKQVRDVAEMIADIYKVFFFFLDNRDKPRGALTQHNNIYNCSRDAIYNIYSYKGNKRNFT